MFYYFRQSPNFCIRVFCPSEVPWSKNGRNNLIKRARVQINHTREQIKSIPKNREYPEL